MPKPCHPLTSLLPLIGLAACMHQPAPGFSPDEQALLQQRARLPSPKVLNQDKPAERALLEHASRPIDPKAPGLPALLDELERTAQALHGGGIAAVQIGIPVRAVLLRREATRNFQAFLNPEPTQVSTQRMGSWERCLSVPWGYRYIERAASLSVRYQTPSGESRSETLQDGEAAVFQQELDHLDGILLSHGHGPRWFIPENQMAAWMDGLRGLCRDLSATECQALTRARWEARALQTPHP
jgi:peptide deformylase